MAEAPLVPTPDPAPPSGPSPARARAVTVLLVVALTLALREAARLVVPILVSVLCAYAIDPAVAFLVRRRVNRPLAATLVYAAIAMGVLAGGRALAGQVTSLINELPDTVALLQQTISDGTAEPPAALNNLQRAANELQQATVPATAAAPRGVRRVTIVGRRFAFSDYVFKAGQGVIDTALQMFAIIVLTFLLLATGDLYKRKAVMLTGPTLSDKKITVEVIHGIDRQIERYLVVRVLISAIVAVATAVGVWAAGLEHAAVWGLVAGVLNVLPYVGPSAAVGLIALAAFLQFKTLTMVSIVGGIAMTVAALEGNVLTPWLTSRAGELNTVAVFVSVLFWGWLWGMWGLLLSVPIMMVIKATADHIEPLQPLGELLGE